MLKRLLDMAASRPARASAWFALVAATGLLVRGEAARSAWPAGVLVSSDLVYREVGGRPYRLDVYLPDAPASHGGRPAVVAVHGGGWRGGSKADYGRSLAELARQGLAVVAVDYRLSRPGVAAWPGNADDVRAAVRWVRTHAGEYAIDPDRIALMGASAGAHLALVAAFDPDPSVTRGVGPRNNLEMPSGVGAVIDFYGPTDLEALPAESPATAEPIRLLLGGPEENRPSQFKSASPIRLVGSGAPPVLIFHGADDLLVPSRQSLALAEALDRAGVPHRLVVVAGARHGFGLKVGSRDLTPEVLAFLRSAWKD